MASRPDVWRRLVAERTAVKELVEIEWKRETAESERYTESDGCERFDLLNVTPEP